MSEKNESTCKVCQQIKTKILNGSYSINNKRYIDENGKKWNGNVCHECHKAQMKVAMQKLRDSRKSKE